MKFRANDGTIVDAEKITAFRDDKDNTKRYVVFANGQEELRPLCHGFKPEIGDYWVKLSGRTTPLRDGSIYKEADYTAVIGSKLFARTYTAV